VAAGFCVFFTFCAVCERASFLPDPARILRPHGGPTGYPFLRTPPRSFGWGWGCLSTCSSPLHFDFFLVFSRALGPSTLVNPFTGTSVVFQLLALVFSHVFILTALRWPAIVEAKGTVSFPPPPKPTGPPFRTRNISLPTSFPGDKTRTFSA